MSTVASIEKVRGILNSSAEIKFTEHTRLKCVQFVCRTEGDWFRESFTKKFRYIRKATLSVDNFRHIRTITIPFECTPIKLEDKYSTDEIKSKIKSIKRAKPIAQSHVKCKFTKYTPNMTMDRYCAEYSRLNRENRLNLLPLASQTSHSTSLYDSSQVDFDIVHELVTDM